jgi:hypothetical protein
VRGQVKSVDPTAGTITVSAFGARPAATADRTFPVAPDAEIVVDPGTGRRGIVQAAKLGDLSAGSAVVLTLTADQKAVEAIVAEAATARGVIKSVDATARTLTLNPLRSGDQEKVYTLAADAEIGVDDGRGRRFSVKEGKFADLTAGCAVTLWLSPDQKLAVAVLAEGPTLTGTLKAVDADKKSVTVSVPPTRGNPMAEEKSLTLAPDATVLMDDGRGRRLSVREGKLADVPAGSLVSVRLTADQKAVTMVRAEGPTLAGILKALDKEKGTVTVSVRAARGGDPEEKTLPIAKTVRVVVEGKEGALADVKPGDDVFALLRLTLDQKAVQSIVLAGRGRE